MPKDRLFGELEHLKTFCQQLFIVLRGAATIWVTDLRRDVDLLLSVIWLLHNWDWGRYRTHDRGRELNFNDLVLVPDTVDNLVFGLINRFTRTVLFIVFPETFVLETSDQVDMSATSVLHICFK